MTSRMRCTAIAVLLVALTGCKLFGVKAKAGPAPAPPLPQAVEEKAPPPKVEPPGPPPKIETKAPEVPSAVAVAVIPNPPAPKPKKKTPRRVLAGTGVAQTPAPPIKDPLPAPVEATVPVPPPASVPKLGEIYSDDQKVQLQKNCDDSLARARDAMRQLRGLILSPEQKQSLARVRVFIGQAEQARMKDPQTAKQLAERADLLSRDLLRSVR